MQETRVGSLGWKDPLEEEMATHSSILAWKISWTGEPGGLQSVGLQRVVHDYHTHLLSPYGSQTALNVFNTSHRWNSDLNILNASLK